MKRVKGGEGAMVEGERRSKCYKIKEKQTENFENQ